MCTLDFLLKDAESYCNIFFAAFGNERFVHFPAVPDDQGSRESIESETTPFHAANLYNDLAHDGQGPDHDSAHVLTDGDRHLFLEIPVVKLESETVGAEHEIFDPMAYEESVDDLHKMDSDWPFKEPSVNDINYEDPYDFAEVKTGGLISTATKEIS